MLGTLDCRQIEDLLHAEVVGRIGCHTSGRTYVVPITYAYDGAAVYGHSAEGLKLAMMRENPDVCFEVDRMENMADWRSVIAWGTFEELHGDAARLGMTLLLRRLTPLLTSESAPIHGPASSPTHPEDPAERPAVLFRIVLREKTGRFEKR